MTQALRGLAARTGRPLEGPATNASLLLPPPRFGEAGSRGGGRAVDHDAVRFRAIAEVRTGLMSPALPDSALVCISSAYAQHFSQDRDATVGAGVLDCTAPRDRQALRTLRETVL
jgi:hypothetical protein